MVVDQVAERITAGLAEQELRIGPDGLKGLSSEQSLGRAHHAAVFKRRGDRAPERVVVGAQTIQVVHRQAGRSG